MHSVLATSRLLLRGFEPHDWRDLVEYITDPAVLRYEPGYPEGEAGAKDVANFFSSSDEFWAVCLNGKVIGHVHFGKREPIEADSWNLGFVFNPKYQHHGYATEASARIMRYGFEELEVRRIEAGCNPENGASWRLLERLGMRREAHHIQNAIIKRQPDGSPIFWDSYEYAILREEYLRR